MYVTDTQTDRQMEGRIKSTLIAPFPTVGGIIISKVVNWWSYVILIAGVRIFET